MRFFRGTILTDLIKSIETVDQKVTNYTPPASLIESAVMDYLIANPPAGYTHPSTHPATMITEDSLNRFVTDVEKLAWNNKAEGGHTHAGYAAESHNHLGAYEPIGAVNTHEISYNHGNYNMAYSHSQVVHAPANAQKNSDITKEEIEAKLTGLVSTHSHSGGADGEVSVVLDQDRATASASFVDVTGMTFTALANSTYIIEFFLVFQSNNTTYGIGYGITGPGSPSFCVGHVDLMLAASTRYVNNITGYNTVDGTSGSVVAINTNYPGYVWVILRTGANGGAVTLRQRSENAAGTVTTKAGSALRYRKVA